MRKYFFFLISKCQINFALIIIVLEIAFIINCTHVISPNKLVLYVEFQNT